MGKRAVRGFSPILRARRLATAKARNEQKAVLCPADKGKQDVTRLLGAVVLRSNTTISTVALFLALDVGGGKGGLGGKGG